MAPEPVFLFSGKTLSHIHDKEVVCAPLLPQNHSLLSLARVNTPHHFCVLTLESGSSWTFLTHDIIATYVLSLVVKLYPLPVSAVLRDRCFWGPLACISLAQPGWVIEPSTPPLSRLLSPHSVPLQFCCYRGRASGKDRKAQQAPPPTWPTSGPYKTLTHPMLDCLCHVDHS